MSWESNTEATDYAVLCAVVYQSPKYNKDYVYDFSDFLTWGAGVVVLFDAIFIIILKTMHLIQ